METILKEFLLFAPLQTEAHFIFERPADVKHLFDLLDDHKDYDIS